MADPTVSVVVPLYNSAPHVEATLESLQAQSFADWECVLVDDGSTDDTPTVVRRFLADPRFRYLAQANGGIAAARNTGIAVARGEWIAFLDHDDRWLPTKLEAQLALARGGFDLLCTDAEMVAPESRRRHGAMFSRHLLDQVQRERWVPGTDVLGLLLEGNFLCTSSVLIARRVLDRVGPLDQSLAPADDYDLWLRCADVARFGYVREPLVVYRIHDGNFSRDGVRLARQAIAALQRTRGRRPERAQAVDARLRVVYAQLLWALLKRGRPREAAAELRALARTGAGGSRVGLGALALLGRDVGARKLQRAHARLRALTASPRAAL